MANNKSDNQAQESPGPLVTGIRILSVDERPQVSRQGKLTNEVVISVQTDLENTGQIVLPAAQYKALAQNPEGLAAILENKRNELDMAHLVTL